jgi:hypothetical protein
MQYVSGNSQGRVGCNHVQMIRKDFSLPSFFHGQCGFVREDFRQVTAMRRIKMLYEDEGHSRTGRNARKKRGTDSSPPAEAPMPTIGKDIAFPLILGYHALRQKRRKNERDGKIH